GRHLLAVVPERRSGAQGSGTTTMARAFQVLRIPLDGSEPTPTGLTVGVTNALNPPQFHPDGRTMTYLDGHNSSEVWVLEGLLEELEREE
ncbi:MAG: hypothetical protein R3190_12355, partial [Thermoanaerobaculia bacterium]|nr:hypothetical protein [Thermoanaerobaculia bacterium]